MTEQELRAQITNEIFSSLKFETIQTAKIITAVCVTVIVDDAEVGAPQSVCRFFLQDGTFIGEVPAKQIVANDGKTRQAR